MDGGFWGRASDITYAQGSLSWFDGRSSSPRAGFSCAVWIFLFGSVWGSMLMVGGALLIFL